VAAEDYALPGELEQLLRALCAERGLPERQHDAIRQLLSSAPSEWPVCCRGSCSPCVDEQKSVAREILLRARRTSG
jgi:hypothetical protein